MKGNLLLICAAVLILATSLVFAGMAQSNAKVGAVPALAVKAPAPPAPMQNITIVEAEGPVVAITSWDTNLVMLKTNYFYGKGAPPLSNVLYVVPRLTEFTNLNSTPYEPRACFDMTYYDANKNVIHSLDGNDICTSVGDSGMIIEALKVAVVGPPPGGSLVQGRVLITAPLVP